MVDPATHAYSSAFTTPHCPVRAVPARRRPSKGAQLVYGHLEDERDNTTRSGHDRKRASASMSSTYRCTSPHIPSSAWCVARRRSRPRKTHGPAPSARRAMARDWRNAPWRTPLAGSATWAAKDRSSRRSVSGGGRHHLSSSWRGISDCFGPGDHLRLGSG